MKAQIAAILIATFGVFARAGADQVAGASEQSDVRPCPPGWTRDGIAAYSLCHPADWKIAERSPTALTFQSANGSYLTAWTQRDDSRDRDAFYRTHTQIIEFFDREIPPDLRRACGMDRIGFTPSPTSEFIGGQDARVIADGGMRALLIPRGPQMFVFIGCTRQVYSQPGQAFYKTFFEVENTIAFLQPTPPRTVDPNAPPDDRILGRWVNRRATYLDPVEYRFEGNRFYENNQQRGTFSAQNGAFVVRYVGGRTVSCQYDFLYGQLILTKCNGDFPTVFEPAVRR